MIFFIFQKFNQVFKKIHSFLDRVDYKGFFLIFLRKSIKFLIKPSSLQVVWVINNFFLFFKKSIELSTKSLLSSGRMDYT